MQRRVKTLGSIPSAAKEKKDLVKPPQTPPCDLTMSGSGAHRFHPSCAPEHLLPPACHLLSRLPSSSLASWTFSTPQRTSLCCQLPPITLSLSPAHTSLHRSQLVQHRARSTRPLSSWLPEIQFCRTRVWRAGTGRVSATVSLLPHTQLLQLTKEEKTQSTLPEEDRAPESGGSLQGNTT